MTALFLPFIVTICATVCIAAHYRDARAVVYVSKPLTTLLIILLAVLCPPADRLYQMMILMGLVFGLAGDVFLMLPDKPRNYFLPGLVSFLIGHVFYVIGFTTKVTCFGSHPLTLLPFALVGAALCAYLWRHLGPMKIPVVCYTAVIVAMTWRATVRIQLPDVAAASAVLATIGAILFMVSDSCLAIARFSRPFPGSRAVILGTYFAAQTLIALSVRG